MKFEKNEIFEIVDDLDRVIGRAPRARCHGDPALIHRVAHVLVINSHGDLLLQKRSEHKDIQPGRWDTSVGGHLSPGETYLEAACREMEEELGIRGISLFFLYPSKIRNEIESENVATFLGRFDGEVVCPSEEIQEARFWQTHEIEMALGKDVFTPNFEQEWALFCDWMRKHPNAFILRQDPGDSLR